MSSDATTQVDTLYNASYTQNILVAWECTNDVYYGATAQQAYDHYVSYCQARRTAGFKVIALTVLPRSDSGTPPGFEAARQQVNTWIRANWQTFANRLADVAADTRIGDAGDQASSYYSGDLVHLGNTGYTLIAQTVQTQVLVLAAPDIIAPAAPILSVTPGNEKNVLTTVAPADSDTAGILIYRAGVQIADVPATPGQTVSYTDTGRTNGVVYSYTARAYDTAPTPNLSVPSAAKNATPTAVTDADVARIAVAVAAAVGVVDFTQVLAAIDTRARPEDVQLTVNPTPVDGGFLASDRNALADIATRFGELPPGPTIVIPAPTSPDRTNAWIVTCDATGIVRPKTSASIRLLKPVGTGRAFVRAETRTSDEEGLLTIELMKGARYELAFLGQTQEFTAGSGSTFAIPSILGK
jgi:hypothetical protein